MTKIRTQKAIGQINKVNIIRLIRDNRKMTRLEIDEKDFIILDRAIMTKESIR
jgi:hypothetical protein